ncbi:MAG: glycosyltransferase family 2 protein [Smithellaceae bacterium]|nr:glycosyltransferase family 2 protein [Smithellaceae bacterium]
MSERIGVVMATFNGERYLEEQLESILNQSVSPARVVIVDDGSTDRTGEILCDYARQDGRIAVYPGGVNLGWIKNFERGIVLCDTELIALADQDDVWRPDKLEACLSRMSADPRCGLCYHDAGLVHADGRPLGFTLWEMSADKYPLSVESARAILLDTRSPLAGFTLVFSRELKNMILPFPGDRVCAHDWWISAVAFFLYAPSAIAQPLVDHRIHGDQTIGDVAGRLRGTRQGIKKSIFSLERIKRNVRREFRNLFQRKKIIRQRAEDRVRRREEFADAFLRLAELVAANKQADNIEQAGIIKTLIAKREELLKDIFV